jgi:hypothetical protein
MNGMEGLQKKKLLRKDVRAGKLVTARGTGKGGNGKNILNTKHTFSKSTLSGSS